MTSNESDDAARPPQPQPPQRPPPSLQRLLEQLEAANGGVPDAEARQALAELSRVMAETNRAVAGDAREAMTTTTTTEVVAAEAAAAAEAQAAAAAAAAAEALAARVSALESRIEELAPETTAIVAEALAETIIKGGGDAEGAL